jgi:hypothetical protein
MSVRQYSVRELRRVIKESSNEFKPVMGRNVEKDNKKINVKAYQEIENETRNYDGGATKDYNQKEAVKYIALLGKPLFSIKIRFLSTASEFRGIIAEIICERGCLPWLNNQKRGLVVLVCWPMWMPARPPFPRPCFMNLVPAVLLAGWIMAMHIWIPTS